MRIFTLMLSLFGCFLTVTLLVLGEWEAGYVLPSLLFPLFFSVTAFWGRIDGDRGVFWLFLRNLFISIALNTALASISSMLGALPPAFVCWALVITPPFFLISYFLHNFDILFREDLDAFKDFFKRKP